MKEWLTAREIAAEQLPGMPTTESAVIRYAERHDWQGRPRAGKGGATEYAIAWLPQVAQVTYVQRHMIIEVPGKPAQAFLPVEGSDKAQLESHARAAIVQAFNKFSRGLQLGYASRVQVFCDKYNQGSIAVADFVRETVPTISKRSLARWQEKHRQGKALGHDPAKSRKGTGVLETANGGAVKAFILGKIAHAPHLSAEAVRDHCRHEFGDFIIAISKGVETAVEMPPVRTFQHTLKHLKERHKVELLKLTNPDAYRSHYAPAGVGMLARITEPNQMWQIDASPQDAACLDGRYSIYVCLDVATRRKVVSLSRTPSASAVALLIRKAILAWGVPDLIKTDNGTDFVARDTERLFAALGIDWERSTAYSPQQKGHVERAIKTFQHSFCHELPGYIGHDVADRQAIRARKAFAERLGEKDENLFCVELSAAEMQAKADDWVEIKYHNTPHSGIDGRTPFQAALASKRPFRAVDERALDLLLMPVADGGGIRVVTKTGIRVNYYDYMPERILPGTEVLVRMDPADLGRVYAFSPDGGEFLGDAVCPELSGRDPKQVAAERKAAAKAYHEEATAPIKATVKRIARGGPGIDARLEVARRDAPNVIALPKREEEHTTPQIAAALDAIEAKTRAPENKTLTGRAAEILTELQTRPAEPPPGVTRLRTEETPQQRFRRALDLRARHEAGEELQAAELLWLGGYEAGPEYRGMKKMHDAFDGSISM